MQPCHRLRQGHSFKHFSLPERYTTSSARHNAFRTVHGGPRFCQSELYDRYLHSMKNLVINHADLVDGRIGAQMGSR